MTQNEVMSFNIRKKVSDTQCESILSIIWALDAGGDSIPNVYLKVGIINVCLLIYLNNEIVIQG